MKYAEEVHPCRSMRKDGEKSLPVHGSASMSRGSEDGGPDVMKSYPNKSMNKRNGKPDVQVHHNRSMNK